jgi:indole-3-glycerol phosphate synthase
MKTAGIPKGITKTGTILDKIVARKIEEVAALDIDYDAVPRFRAADFVGALVRWPSVALIAEIKHASPSRGILVENFDPVALAKTYAENGADAISVLTDKDFFQGSLDDLYAVKSNVSTPVLRKDFIIDERQVIEGRLACADAILLIVAILDDARLRDLLSAVRDYDMVALIEVHTEAEMERALKLDPRLVGINNRDLHTFVVDLNVTQRLAALAPADVTLVAESGIFTAADVEAMAAAGVDAILVGESIVKAPDAAAQIRALSSVKKSAEREGRRS